jgi:carboxymethylenebutenolidase
MSASDSSRNTARQVDPRVLELYNEYAHGRLSRRDFMNGVAAFAVGGVSVAALVSSVLPDYAAAMTISFTDERIRPEYVEYPSPEGSGRMRGYLVRPTQVDGPAPAVLVMHENRGLNPYIEDVARRAAVQGFLALAPDGLTPVGGYPGNDDDGRRLQASLDPTQLDQDMIASARFLKSHADSTGRLGATGFCWGGGMTKRLAAAIGTDLDAGVPWYGAAPSAEQAARIRTPLLIQYAENDERINAMWPDFERVLQANGVEYVMHMYPGTMHGFHNNSTPRFDEAAAALAEQRMWEFFRTHLHA